MTYNHAATNTNSNTARACPSSRGVAPASLLLPDAGAPIRSNAVGHAGGAVSIVPSVPALSARSLIRVADDQAPIPQVAA